jgi:hypothetical protein
MGAGLAACATATGCAAGTGGAAGIAGTGGGAGTACGRSVGGGAVIGFAPSRGNVTPHVTQKRYIGGLVVPHVAHSTEAPAATDGVGAPFGSDESFVLLAGTGAIGAAARAAALSLGDAGAATIGPGGALSGRDRPAFTEPAAGAAGGVGTGAGAAAGVGAGAGACACG